MTLTFDAIGIFRLKFFKVNTNLFLTINDKTISQSNYLTFDSKPEQINFELFSNIKYWNNIYFY